MLNVLGLGAAVPERIIDNKLLGDLGLISNGDILKRSGIVARHTTLMLDYIRTTKNACIGEAVYNAVESPTDLAQRAAHIALKRAGITSEQLGLIIGECSTPVETTPSEAQRLGNRLGLRIPAFDVCAGYIGPAGLAFETLEQLRTERIPDYILIVSTQTPTQKVDYSQGIEGLIFGDCAVAMVVSASIPGPVRMTRSSFKSSDRSGQISFNTLSRAIIKQPLDFNEIGRVAADVVRQAVSDGVALERCAFVGPQIGIEALNYLHREFNIPEALRWSDIENNGYGLGAAELSVVARRWDELILGSKSVLTIGAIGPITGYAVFES
jgi:3-oxoacyl-[acyl-carrier-protein] synthase III